MTTPRKLQRGELVTLAWRARGFPNMNIAEQLAEISPLPDAARDTAFAALCQALTDEPRGLAVEHQLDVLLDTARFTPGDAARAESWTGCPSCGGRELVFVGPVPEFCETQGFFRCDNAAGHVRGAITVAFDYTAVTR